MSGLEVLGALAAASQLAEQGLKITTTIYDIYRKVRDAPESIRKQTVQVEQLIDIAKLIKGTASLQTDLVASVLRDCTTDAHKVLHSLQQIAPGSELHAPKKLWKALAGITKEKNILEHLTKLEQGKSSLALCIATIDNSLLKSIHLEMVTVQTAVDGISKELPAIRDSIRKVTTVLYAVDVLPTMAEDVGNIHQELAALVQKLTTVYDELPAISGKVAAIHDELLPRMQEDMQKLVLNQSNPAPVSPVQPAKGLVMVPYARNRLFVGRDAQLQDLKVKLANNEHNRVALVGLGGVGKSQLALEHAYRRREEDPQLSVFWVRASNASRFEQDFLQIGKFAKFLESNSLSQDPKETIKKWLDSENSGMWLLILDSADDSEIIFGARKANERMMLKGLSEFLPQSTNGTIIFTTRNRKVGVKFATTEGIITMPNMEAVDAEKLYMAQSGENTTDEDSVAELLARLEYLPLAITQAGSYISENTISTSDYLGMFNESESSRIELLSEEFEDAARDGGSVNPIATTYMISFEQINHSNALAADLLSYMACLDDQSVPKKLLNLPTSPVKATSALGLLKAYSLISADQTNTIFIKTKRFAAEEEAKYDDFVNKRQKSSELQSHHANWEKSLGPHHPITLRSLSNRIEMPYSAWKTIERLGLEHDVPEATLRNSLVVAQNWRSLEDCELDETRAISTNALPLSDLQPLARSTTENVASEHTLDLDKYQAVLASPTRDEMNRFCNRDGDFHAKYGFWCAYLKNLNDFMARLVPSTRFVDMNLWTALSNMQPRTKDGIDLLSLPADGGIETTSSPFPDRNRSSELLTDLTDDQYREVHRAARRQENPNFKDFAEPENAANDLIGMVAPYVWEHIDQFAPKMRPAYDAYPTVTLKDPSTGKERDIEVQEDMKRFASNWSWFSLAKLVSRFIRYQLAEGFMAPFNDSAYQCFVMDDTEIPEDVVRGVISVVGHGEVVTNPLLHNNKAFLDRVNREFRRTVVLAAHDAMQKGMQEGKHQTMDAKQRDHVMREASRFKVLADQLKPRPVSRGSQPGSTHRRDEDDDDDDDDGGSGGPPRHQGKMWSMDALTQVEKEITDRFRPPEQRNQNRAPDDSVEMQDAPGTPTSVGHSPAIYAAKTSNISSTRTVLALTCCYTPWRLKNSPSAEMEYSRTGTDGRGYDT
ncbi:hypothetical protein P7C71_g1739, partial [Lecanoromycetidae sp. Uapishka_2]